MTRILAILLVLLLLLIVAQRGLAALRASPLGRTLSGAWHLLWGGGPPSSSRRPSVERDRGPVRLVACRGCGVHVPETEVSRSRGLCERCRS